MISRKDNLLIRPWQQRKFEHHRRKVQSALPAIDTNPPPYRGHVIVKLKKQQKENERCEKIERDNYLLLQKMNYITKTSRVDNVWKSRPPNFLNKIAIYNSVIPEIEDVISYGSELQLTDNENEPRNRKSNCYACRSQKIKKADASVEQIPSQPTKKLITRSRSKSVPVRKPEILPLIMERSSFCEANSFKKYTQNDKQTREQQKSEHKAKKEMITKEPHRITINRGCLKLSVNFPSDTVVKFEKGNIQKILMNEFCHCKNSCKHTMIC